MTGARQRMTAAALLLVGLLGAQTCAPWGRHPDPAHELARIMASLAQEAARTEGEGDVAVLGFRDPDGKRTTATEILDDYLVSALLEAGVPLSHEAADAGATWGKEGAIPASQWQGLASTRVAGGRLHDGSPWAYLRFFVIDRESGSLMVAGTRRLPASALRRQVAERSRQTDAAPEPTLVSVDLHILGLRNESGGDQSVPVREAAALLTGDRLQVRFETQIDCQVYAFLCTSTGEIVEVFGNSPIYAGRMQFGPGEEKWVTVTESDREYTLYFIAAPSLDEDWSEFSAQLNEQIERGEVERRGLQVLDQALADFVGQRLPDTPVVTVVREVEEDALGPEASFYVGEDTTIRSRPERLGPSPAVVRALTFEVH